LPKELENTIECSEGYTAAEIGDIFELSRCRVQGVMRQHNIPSTQEVDKLHGGLGQAIYDISPSKLRELFIKPIDGYSSEEISEMIDRSRSIINKTLKRAKTPWVTAGCTRRYLISIDDINALFPKPREGFMCLSKLSSNFDISVRTIRDRVRMTKKELEIELVGHTTFYKVTAELIETITGT